MIHASCLNKLLVFRNDSADDKQDFSSALQIEEKTSLLQTNKYLQIRIKTKNKKIEN